MPTRPTRRERRRADRRNAKNPSSVLPTQAPLSLSSIGPLSPSVFLNAAPIIRTVMRVVLIQTSFTASQVYGLKMWKGLLQHAKPPPTAPDYAQHEYQISCFEAIINMHGKQVHDLRALHLDYAKEVAMWGFECSKVREEWDLGFIARRKLELAQLNRVTNRLAVAFEERLQGLLGNERAFSSQTERACVLRMLETFRESFAEGVEIADKETSAALVELGV